MPPLRPASIIALDIGMAFTKAMLFDVDGGEARLCAKGQAPSTLYRPDADAGLGVMAALRRVEETAGRPLLGPKGLLLARQDDGHGVDDCFIVSSVNSLLRVLVVAATSPALAGLRSEAAALPSVEISGALALDVKLPPNQSFGQQLLTALDEQRPQVLAIDGGVKEDRLIELAEALNIGARTGSATPAVVVVGGEQSTAGMRGLLQAGHTFRCLPRGDKGGAGFSPFQQHLRLLWAVCWQEEVPGAAVIASWCTTAPAPTQQGFADALRFVAAHEQCDVWGLEIGAKTAVAVRVADGATATRVRGDLGMGLDIAKLLDNPAAVDEWSPARRSAAEGPLSDLLLQKHLRATAPEVEAKLSRDGAVACAIAREVLDGWSWRTAPVAQKPVLLVGSGPALTETPSLAHGHVLLLDAFRPVGFVELALDNQTILPALGAIAQRYPDLAAELVLREGLRSLGQCIVLDGTAKEGSVALKMAVERAYETGTVETTYGLVKVLPFNKGETARVTVAPAGRLDCGAGPGRKATLSVRGGPLGVVVDARGRPSASV